MINIKLTYLLVILLCLFSNIQSQDIGTLEENTPVFDCENIATNSVEQIFKLLVEEHLDSCDILLEKWENYCGGSEVLYRIKIYLALVRQQDIIGYMNTYYMNDYTERYLNRYYASKENDYGNIYTDNKAYYSFVPLRSKIDSLLTSRFININKSTTLSTDEELMCLVFSGDEEAFTKRLKSARKKESYLKRQIVENSRKYSDYSMGYNIYTGIYKSIGSDDFFGRSTLIGFTFSSPLKYKLQVELGIKFRINHNSKNFDFVAMDMTHNVNSDYSVFFGGLVGYKVLNNKFLKLIPKFGIGLESVSTGISEEIDHSAEKEYYDVNVPHLSLGISALTPIFRRNYIGLEMTYHYCPYHWNSNLQSQFNNNHLSTELIYKF